DDGVLEPVKGLDYKYYHSRFNSGPVNNRGGNGGQDENEEIGDDQELWDAMEEIDRFEGGAMPTQPQQ
ncbi:hypothetical protein A2U01_0088327, partial [Trifolium medium]|nr:hypothetical protein [Trifolium medium]